MISRALVLAPRGRDALVAASLLQEGAIPAEVCVDIAALVARLGDDTGFVVIADEELVTGDVRALSRWVELQPEWSDLPFIVLTRHGGGLERNPAAARTSSLLGNVNFLERPFHPTTFLSMAQSARRNRGRQYETRAHLLALGQLNEHLEQRVASQIEQRERAEEQLRQAQKMEMLGQLTGGVAHDFNNLLMVVMVNLELLSRLVPSQPNTRQLIDAAMQSTRRGAALTQRLLAFSRRQELVLESHPLDRLIEGMRDLLQRSIGTTYELVLSLPAGLPPALVDANQIELAILNLVVNARDAMPEGGKLEVTLSRGLPPAELGIVCSEGACLCVAVTDSGLGMDADTLRRAKEPFFSTKPLGKGTGLGLSMIDGLARQLNGALHLQSTPGHGTRAELWLPAAPRSAATAESLGEQKASEPTPMDPLHVLVVDDDAAVAEGTRGLLGSLGHRVTVADSGEKALAMLDASQVPDVLITDYAMPHMTGAQLATIVRKRFPDMPVILASGYADTPAEFDPALPRLHKPYERHALAEMLRTTQPGTSSRAS